MKALMNISDLSKLLTQHAQQMGRNKTGPVQNERMADAALTVLKAIEKRAAGVPEIAEVTHSVRKALQVRSE